MISLAIVITMTMGVSTSYAEGDKQAIPTLQECVDDCNALIKKADTHIAALDEENLRRQLLINFLESNLIKTRAQLTKKFEEDYAWHRNIAITFPLGIILGFIVGGLAK